MSDVRPYENQWWRWGHWGQIPLQAVKARFFCPQSGAHAMFPQSKFVWGHDSQVSGTKKSPSRNDFFNVSPTATSVPPVFNQAHDLARERFKSCLHLHPVSIPGRAGGFRNWAAQSGRSRSESSIYVAHAGNTSLRFPTRYPIFSATVGEQIPLDILRPHLARFLRFMVACRGTPFRVRGGSMGWECHRWATAVNVKLLLPPRPKPGGLPVMLGRSRGCGRGAFSRGRARGPFFAMCAPSPLSM